MRLGGFDGLFFRSCEWISRFAYVNVLWFTFMVMGIGIFGVFPATVALFAIIRKWLMGESTGPILQTYWKIYRKEFVKSNLLGLLIVVIGFILYVDLAYLPVTGAIYTVIRYAVIAISFAFFILALYIFPVYVHYQGTIKSYLKYALMASFAYPLFTLMMIIGSLAIYTGLSIFPGLTPFYSICLLAFLNMWIALQVFRKMDGREVLNVTEIEVESINQGLQSEVT